MTVKARDEGTEPLSTLLKGHPYCLLTTHRKDGTPVPTPLWFALDGETVYMRTLGGSAKVKRIRRNPEVTIGPCDAGGRPTGPQRKAQARILADPSEEAQAAERSLSARYGLKRRLLLWALRFNKDKTNAILAVEAVPDEPQEVLSPP